MTIVSTSGSTPQRVGAKMLVYEDGRTAGTIGGGCYEHDAAGKAREAIRLQRPQLVRYSLNDELAAESGLICGGQMEVYIEPVEPAPDLYLVGAGHVSVEVARIAQLVGFRVHVVDDREKFANAERFPGADVVVDDIPDWLRRESSRPAPTSSSSPAGTATTTRPCGSWSAASRLPRPDRQPGKGRPDLRGPGGEGADAGRPVRRARAHRPRHRRGHPGRDRGQHRGRTDGRPVWPDCRAPRGGGGPPVTALVLALVALTCQARPDRV